MLDRAQVKAFARTANGLNAQMVTKVKTAMVVDGVTGGAEAPVSEELSHFSLTVGEFGGDLRLLVSKLRDLLPGRLKLGNQRPHRLQAIRVAGGIRVFRNVNMEP